MTPLELLYEREGYLAEALDVAERAARFEQAHVALERVAARLANLRVDETNFRSERAVVQEEYRQRILASPYGLFFETVSTRRQVSPSAGKSRPYHWRNKRE